MYTSISMSGLIDLPRNEGSHEMQKWGGFGFWGGYHRAKNVGPLTSDLQLGRQFSRCCSG